MESQLQQSRPALRNVILKGKNSYIDEFGFVQLARIFPAIEHFALLGVDGFFVRESSRIMHRTTIWPKLYTISMIPVVAEDILCSLILARTRPTSQTPLKTLIVGPGKLPNRSVRRKPEISASNPLRFGPKIRYLGQGCHGFHAVTC